MSAFNYKLGLLFVPFLIETIYTTADNTQPCEDLTEECLIKKLQLAIPIFVQGIPRLNIETLDPYNINKLELFFPGNFTVYFREGIAKGLKTCVIDMARLVNNVLETQLYCNITITGKYEVTGRLLIFPIDGEGNATIHCSNIRIYSILKLGYRIEKDAQRYLEILQTKSSHTFDDKVSYNFTNLIKGNPEMSNALVNLINQNWRMIAEQFGNPLVDYGTSLVTKNMKKLLKLVPLDQIKPINLSE